MRIATRASELARWQAEHVGDLLRRAHDDLKVEIVPVSTEGDRRVDVPLSEIGGKGVFVKEVQRAVLSGEADLAVHSAKDLPAITPDGLTLAAVPPRGEVRDALVGADLDELRALAAAGDRPPVVATGSARRRVQLAELVSGVVFEELRGNMATRLAKAVDFDAIVVAAVALGRLGLAEQVTEMIDAAAMVPQVGQGALAVECRSDDQVTCELVRCIEDPRSRIELVAERAFLAELGGDCSLPAGAHCTLGADGLLRMVAVLAPSVPPSGAGAAPSSPVDVARVEDSGENPDQLGRSLAASLVGLLGES